MRRVVLLPPALSLASKDAVIVNALDVIFEPGLTLKSTVWSPRGFCGAGV
jgi:hypothetical protein